MESSKGSGGHTDIPSDASTVFEGSTGSLTGLHQNDLYHDIVLPSANFEPVYDQRDSDEVFSDIRQVKSELEKSVLGHNNLDQGDSAVLDAEPQSSSRNGFNSVSQVEVQNMLILADLPQTLQSSHHLKQSSVRMQPTSHVLRQEQLDQCEPHVQEQSQVIRVRHADSIVQRRPQKTSQQAHIESQLQNGVSVISSQLQDVKTALQMILDPTVTRQQSQHHQSEPLSDGSLHEMLPRNKVVKPTQRSNKTEQDAPMSGKVKPVIEGVAQGIAEDEEVNPQDQRLSESTSEDLRELSRTFSRDNANRVVTIKVEDRLPGESFMEVEVNSVGEIGPESPVSAFCATYTNPSMREEITIRTESAEPTKDIIVTSDIDSELTDLIKLKLKMFENLREDAATQLLSTDALLSIYQGLLRKLSAPVLELAELLENGKVYDTARIKKAAGNILCQLVMFNERVIRDRRAKILQYLGRPANLADDHRIPQRCGEALFGRLFVDQHHLAELKRVRRKTAQNTETTPSTVLSIPCQQHATVNRAKRRRKSFEDSSGGKWANAVNVDKCVEGITGRSNRADKGDEEEETYNNDKDVDFSQPSDVCNDEDIDEEILDGIKVQTEMANAKKTDVPSLVKIERKIDNNCDHCDYIAEKRRQLASHVENAHPDKMIACDACDKRFAFQISLWNHKNAMHLGAEHKCPHPQCTRSFKDEDKLRTHLFVHSTEKPFTCDICGRGCLTKVHLDSHVKVHERRDTQYCQICDRYFGSNHTFRNHMKLHDGKKEWFCDICTAGFPIKPRLVLHKKIAHSDEQFVCDECGKGFKMKHILNDHKALIHSTRKAFVCEVCGVGFKLRSVLRRHMKTHSDERPHKCELCDKAFKVKSTLVEHRKTHTNEKPFLCEQCGVAFKRNAERRKHNCMGGTKHVVMQMPLSHDESVGHGHEPIAQLVTSTGSTQVQLPQVSTGHGSAQLQVAVVTSGSQATTQHLVTHMPLQLGAQMIQIMGPGTLVSPVQNVQSGGQLMVQQVVQQLHDVQHTESEMHAAQASTPASGTSTGVHAQFANFPVS
ncbi:hypothetical protein BIW11_08063 [Tropilaelaps mercedesae]|uniref:C2H2-type domain-containing protein n=1 Tax=Tropilaelaps mercedesae TaxID=418985 RepID=A0A1V9XR69_9ACAR|nr:hypothetical protein BIW11_08063 [Tropilaelaps mercedesae]